MLKIRIIPCLDVKDGKVVKGTKFVNLKYAGDPVKQAQIYDKQGADELCFLDITASSDKRNILFNVVKKTAQKCFMPLTVGGGVRSIKDIRKLLLCGADKVSINTAAIQNPNLIKKSSSKFGNQCIVVAIDAKKIKKNKWEIYTHGGRTSTGLDAVEWAREAVDRGSGELLVTSMDTDGHQTGYDIPMLQAINEAVSVPIIASGGAGEPEHLYEALTAGGADAVLAASIFHFGKYDIAYLKQYLERRGVPIRPIDVPNRSLNS